MTTDKKSSVILFNLQNALIPTFLADESCAKFAGIQWNTKMRESRPN